MKKEKIIIIPFNIPWNWSTDYTNQTAKILSKKNIVICFLWEDVLSLKEYFVARKSLKLFEQLSKNLFIYYPIHIIPFRRFNFIVSLNLYLNIIIVKLLVKSLELKYGRKEKMLWIFHPTFLHLLKLFGKNYVSLYDCVDYSDDIKQENKLIRQANFMTVISKTLYKLHQHKRKDIGIVPQGFRMIGAKGKKVSKFTNKRPIIGFVGGINNRLNLSLLLPLIKNNPKWQFVFWGPIQDKKPNYLFSLSNVIYGVSKNKKELPSIISQFDICIIPYDTSQNFNKYCYPMKLFEYFYMGKPVVSTPIEELKHFPKFVKIGNTAKEWEKHIKTLLSKSWSEKYKKEQKRLAEENSWENKIKAINQLINQ